MDQASTATIQLPHEIHDAIFVVDWQKWLLIVILTIILIFVIYRFIRYWNKPAKTCSLTRFEVAMAKLKGAQPQGDDSEDRIRQFYFVASLVLRDLVEAYHGVSLLEKTIDEVESSLNNLKGSHEWLQFLKKSEQVKFAGQIVSYKEANSDYESLRKWAAQLDPKSKETSKPNKVVEEKVL